MSGSLLLLLQDAQAAGVARDVDDVAVAHDDREHHVQVLTGLGVGRLGLAPVEGTVALIEGRTDNLLAVIAGPPPRN